MKKNDRVYQELYGNIPNDQEGRISYILGTKMGNKKINDQILLTGKGIKAIKYNKIEFTMWKIVLPSPRPRVRRNGGYIHMYVPRAKEEGDWFSEFAKENNLPLIETPCILNMRIYEKTPSSFNIVRKVLAELGLIRPWKRTGDFDNYAKGIADAIQHGMLKDDCLVISSSQDLYYSIKPHADIIVHYMKKFPEY